VIYSEWERERERDMAVPGGRNGMEDDDDDEQQGVNLDGGDGDAWAELDHDAPPHLWPLVDAAQSGDLDFLRSALGILFISSLVYYLGQTIYT
jgi:hypothetical protein